MAKNTMSGELNIQGLEAGIDRLEKKMTSLSANFTRNSNNIIKAFQDININGVQAVITKLDELQKAMNKVSSPQQGQKANPYAKNVDDINKMMAALSKSANVWTNQQKNIADNEKQIARLTASVKNYEEVQRRIKAGGSGVVSNKDKTEYQENLKTLEVLKQQVASWKQKQQAIIQHNKEVQAQLKLQQDLRNAEQQRTSLPNQRKAQELAQMNEYYRQQEIQVRKNYEAQARLNQQQNQAKNTSFAGAMEFSDNATSINRQQKAIEYLTQARAKLNITTAEGQRQAEQLTERIRQHEDAIKRATRTEQENEQAMRKRNEALQRQRQLEQQKWISSSPQEALNYSRTTQSINEQIRAIQYLKQSRDQLTVSSAGGEEAYKRKVQEINDEIKRQKQSVEELKGKQEELKQSKSGLINTADQLQRKLALVFSVSSIQGYVQKLASVRAEFELNQRALGAILQSKDKADEIWGQTVDLALKSPFRVKELVTYTKQLAAYRIESDKLFDTTKRLADVSAGLGVDMQRLILAYGQVRAAEYLRGTELRQFTEAGIPMLEELATYFSEMEGRAVSTADVFQRISKRMVDFADVDAVFQRMTNSGGVFFEMQEKQADTLAGQISNLHDAIDLMLNDIGASNDGVLKGAVETARSLVENWEEVWIRLRNIIFAFGTYKLAVLGAKLATKEFTGVMMISSKEWLKFNQRLGESITKWQVNAMKAKFLNKTLRLVGVGLSRLGLAISGLARAFTAFLPMLAIGAVVELYHALTESSRAAERLNESLTQIDKEVGKELDDSISNYKKLAKVITDGTKSYSEREEALTELQRTFKDVLPSMYLERDTIMEMAGSYEEATKALTMYYSEKAMLQKKEKIDEHYDERILDDMESSYLDLFEMIGVEKTEYLKVFGEVVKEAKKAAEEGYVWNAEALKNSLKSALKEEIDLTEKQYEMLSNLFDVKGNYFAHQLGDINDELQDYAESIASAQGLSGVTTVDAMAEIKQVQKLKEEYGEIKDEISAIIALYSKYGNLIEKANRKGEAVNPEDREGIVEELRNKYESLHIQLPINMDFSEIAVDSLALAEESKRLGLIARKNFAEGFSLDEATRASIKGFFEAINPFSDKDEGGGFLDKIKSRFDKSYAAEHANRVNLLEDIYNDANDLADSSYQAFINNVIRQTAEANNISTKMLNDLVVSTDATSEKVKKDWKSQYDELVVQHLMAKTILDRNPLLTVDYVFSFLGINSESMAELEQKMKAIADAYLRAGFGNINGNNSNKGKKDTSAKDFANVLKEMRSEYEKFNAHFDKNDSANRVRENWADAFDEVKKKVKGLGLTLDDFDFTTIDGMVAAFEKLEATAQGKKISGELKKIIAELRGGENIEKEKEREDARDREIDQMFELYDIYKDLQKIGIDKDAAKSLFGIEATSLEELRKKLEDMKGQFTGTEDEETYQKYIDKITNMENKAQQERLKTYLEYTRAAMTERAKIKFDELNKLAEIEKAFAIKEGDSEEVQKIKETRRAAAIEAVQNESKQKTDKSLWEDFQKSDIFLAVFQDAENASTTMMQHVLDKLKGFKEQWADMPLESVKQLTQKMTELENKLYEAKNPFKALREINKKIQDELTVTTTDESGKEVKTTISKEQLEADARAAQTQIDANNTEIDQLLVINQLLSEGKLINSEQQAIYEQLTGTTDISVDNINAEVNARKDANKNLDKTVQKNNDVNNLQNQGRKALQKQSEAIKQCNQMANDLYDAFSEIWEVVGNDDMAKVWADMGMSIASSVLDTIALQMQLLGATVAAEGFGAAMNSAMGIIGWIVLAVQIVAKVLSAVFEAHDKGLQKDIDDLAEKVELLEKQLEKVEEGLDKVFTNNAIRKGMKEMNDNINAQIESYKEMISLEEEKKKTDEDSIKDWEETIEELGEKRKELHQEMIESLGGTYDVRGKAREFVDAWVESFQETGDGLKGLRDNFKEFFKNIILEQAVMKGAGTIIDPLVNEINNSLGNDYEIDKVEAQKIDRMGEERMVALDNFLNALLGDNGIFNEYITNGESSLSGLQEGIQGVTEETAQIIEAYLNSIRFYIAQDNQNLARLVEVFTNVDTPSPILNELRSQTRILTSINNTLDSIVKTGGHAEGGAFIKVAL